MGGVLGLLAAAVLGAAAAAEPSTVPLDVSAPLEVTGVQGDDASRFLYELRLTNFAPRPVVLESIEVLDGAGTSLAAFEGTNLKAIVAHRGSPPAAGSELTVPPAGFVTVFVEVKTGATPTTSSLIHRIKVAAPAPDTPVSRQVVTAGRVTVAKRPPLTLGPPLRGAGWLAANALSNESDHRRTIAVVDGAARIAQRYAIDFVQLDAKGRAFKGDAGRNESWTGYGADILAVTDGTVVAIRDDLPDNDPGAAPTYPINLATIGGNHVVLDVGGGAYAFYGHLKPGGVLVKPGQRVRRGEVIGNLGNSGQSDAPHLHFHVSDGTTALGGDGVAYAFDRIAVRGYVQSLDVLERPEGWAAMLTSRPIPEAGRLPTANAVIDFAP